ncbi:MAG TPA: patatin-like phospholipase family protein [Pyrinomonadaceae bacterium]|nr:patatin-like phospholipase family protein [Pyrinomonadaceae bacterium]
MLARDVGLTFAGGGNKSFYQFGMMRALRERVLPRVGCVAACSAGACMAALILSGRDREVEEFWRRECYGITRNFEWPRLLSGQSPMRHESIYRASLLHAFSEGGFERVRAQPFPFLVITTAFPKRMPALAAALLGLCLYNLQNGRAGRRRATPLALSAGFTPVVYDARDANSPEELADLIIATSATPPFTSIGRFAGRRLLDGGIIDIAPASLADAQPHVTRNIVLLTSPLPPDLKNERGRRFYIAPLTSLPLKTWDLTRPDLIDAVIDQGERDAETYSTRLAEFLNEPVAVLTDPVGVRS